MDTSIGDADGRVAVVVLNYNNYEDSVECLNRIVGTENLDIVLVDNFSSDDSGQRLAEKYGRSVYYLQAGRNAGYAAGNNVGIKYAIETLGDPYICVLNNDTLPNPGLFSSLADRLDKIPSCGIVGPVILENQPGNVIQSAGADIDFKKGCAPGRHRGEVYQKTDKAEPCSYVGGACMMFRAADIALFGYIPEIYFLFYEETEWCLRAARKKMSVLCDWSCSLVHTGSATISKHKGLASYFNTRNKALFIKRNATYSQRLYFFAYQFFRIFYRRLVRGEDCIWELQAICDGSRNAIGKDFSHLDVIGKTN